MTQVTLRTLQKMHADGEKIAVLTSYDATFASVLDEAGVDIQLIGDSLGMVIQGHSHTLSVSLEQMAYHVANVARGTQRSMIMVDMPFGTFQENAELAFRHASRLMAAGAHMIKLEGGDYLYDTMTFLTQRGIPICAHIGLTPQSVNQLGGYVVQGKTEEAQHQLLKDAKACEAAGASLIVIEAVPASLAKTLNESIKTPTIGIGAGPHCSGQVLVLYDMLGIGLRKIPRFAKNFMSESETILEAVGRYVRAVKEGTFPTEEHSFKS